ncbi:MAG: XRE family transcriptional regulator, partial [Chloroflexi bacterium]|nr:XRE family transcriptional regulator [Chloroflexota bacterium]
MPLPDHLHRLLYRIAQAYYVQELTQQEIAERFGLSRSKVSRLLD